MTSPRASRHADLLVEVGTEELPAAYLEPAIVQLAREAQKSLEAAHLECAAVESFGTPRRLVLLVRSLAATQRHPAEEIRGPSKQAGFDAQGHPTEALKGFLRSRGGTLRQTKIVQTERGDYVYLVKPARETPTSVALPELVPQIVTRLRFPKTMRWDESGFRFARPVRWLLALHGSRPIRTRLGALVSRAATQVGGPKRPRAVVVGDTGRFFALLKREGILLDQRQRKARVLALVTQAAARCGGTPTAESLEYGLLDEVAALLETPVVLVGEFDRKYLDLPRDVLLASMAKHQRVFAIEGKGGALLPTFIAILDGAPRKTELVRRTCEHILNARLADSLLFLQQDRRHRLEDADLSGVTFHEKLGSMAEKTTRLVQLCPALADAWQLTPDERRSLERACRLAKADLVTTMVREFPTLQGVIGKHYARMQSEPAKVADAIAEQYLPTGDRLPATRIGSALSILEKFDTLASYFGIGIEPTGDQDPFGLRRAAQGIVEVAWAVHQPLPLDRLFDVRAAAPPFAAMAPADRQRIQARIERYLFERLATFAWPAPAPSADVIAAVLSAPSHDLLDVMQRIRAIQSLGSTGAVVKAAKVVERTRNILKSATVRQRDVDPSRLQEPPERALWELYTAHKDRVTQAIARRSYAEATTQYGEIFFGPLNEFFDRVMVNVKDEAIQQNRLALMQAINTLYTERVADLSKLALLQSQTVRA